MIIMVVINEESQPLSVFGGSEDLRHVAGVVAADFDLLHRVSFAVNWAREHSFIKLMVVVVGSC